MVCERKFYVKDWYDGYAEKLSMMSLISAQIEDELRDHEEENRIKTSTSNNNKKKFLEEGIEEREAKCAVVGDELEKIRTENQEMQHAIDEKNEEVRRVNAEISRLIKEVEEL